MTKKKRSKAIPYWTAPSNLNFKAVKAKDGQVTIEGFANKNIVDRGNDRIEPDAFDLTNFNKNPIMFFNHDPGFEIGAITDVKKTEDGLFIKGMISNSDDELTKRVRNNIKQGILRSLSVGFDLRDEDKDADGVNVIKSAELMEVSVVGIPMNQDSQFNVTSKADKRAWACKMLDQMEKDHKREKLLEEAEEAEDKEAEKESEEAATAEGSDEDSEGKQDEAKVLLEGRTGPSSAEGDEHTHVVQVESQTSAGTATTVVGETQSGEHTHKVEDGEVMAGGSDEHTHPLDLESLETPESSIAAEETEEKEGDEEEEEDKGGHEDEEEEEGSDHKQDSTTVQTLVLSKEVFDSEEAALAWAKEHDFLAEKVDETDSSFRLRQRDPAEFQEDSFRTIELTEGVSAVLGRLLDDEEESEEDAKSFSLAVMTKIKWVLGKSGCLLTSDDIDELVMTVVESLSKRKSGRITKNHYRIYFAYADRVLECKQAEQEQTENDPTTPVKTDRTEEDFGSPHLDLAKQTNVLLGALINEMQQLRAQVAQLQPQEEVVDEEESESDSEEDEGESEELLSSDNNDNIENEAGRAERALLNISRKYLADLQKRLSKLGV